MAQIVGGIGEGARLTRYSSLQIVEAAGSQGVELLNWITLRGALTGKVGKIHSNYHIPISAVSSGFIPPKANSAFVAAMEDGSGFKKSSTSQG